MGHRRSTSSFSCLLLLVVIALCFSRSAKAYKNYTVGDSLGWFDNLEKPSVNYQKWVSGKQFSLGDFLIFNTDNNHSVIQTYNFTTYKLCDYDDAQDNDTTQWSASDPSATEPHPVTVAVPLVKEGMTYFFSSDYDGEQCKNGQQFKINVSYGQGLPKSLRDYYSSPPSSQDSSSPSPASPMSGDQDVTPDTIVPANFDHPREVDDDDDADERAEKSSAAGSVFSGKIYNFLGSSLVCLGSVVLLFDLMS
ncbi:uclacyanin-3-like [Neltuma alba]|uniref:uclacyanin-3-like n=1 Tax=Neltuma alba TaxID=207710 RepID=UPI0010A33B8A|nr:uclacyanin-3-like [Prosopis alba]